MYYGKAWNGTISAFERKAERDAWVAEGFERMATSASDAKAEAMSHPFVMCHGGARLPKSWGAWTNDLPGETGYLAWNRN